MNALEYYKNVSINGDSGVFIKDILNEEKQAARELVEKEQARRELIEKDCLERLSTEFYGLLLLEHVKINTIPTITDFYSFLSILCDFANSFAIDIPERVRTNTWCEIFNLFGINDYERYYLRCDKIHHVGLTGDFYNKLFDHMSGLSKDDVVERIKQMYDDFCFSTLRQYNVEKIVILMIMMIKVSNEL